MNVSALFKYSKDKDVLRDDIKTYIPAVGGFTIYVFGDLLKLRQEQTEVHSFIVLNISFVEIGVCSGMVVLDGLAFIIVRLKNMPQTLRVGSEKTFRKKSIRPLLLLS